MQVGMIGLGRMGANMVRRLMRGGHECVVHDISADAVSALANKGRPLMLRILQSPGNNFRSTGADSVDCPDHACDARGPPAEERARVRLLHHDQRRHGRPNRVAA